MIRRTVVWLLILMTLSVTSLSQSAADMLQRGIYLQETVGDLDGAINIYHQIIITASKNHAYAAQAQYRLALCLQRKGRDEEARNAFRELTNHYPEEKDLVVKAREQIGEDLKLLPIPWPDGELAEYRLAYPGGRKMANMFRSIEVDLKVPGRLIAETHYLMPSSQELYRANINTESMTMISESDRNSFDSSKTYYHDRQALVQREDGSSQTIDFDGPVFSEEELPLVLRRLPLAPGYKATLSIVNLLDVPTKSVLNVLGTEQIQVPAGSFSCYKLEVQSGGLKQLFWIATNEARLLVKTDVYGMKSELVDLRKIDRVHSVSYEDSSAGFAITAPAGWIIRQQDGVSMPDSLICMGDPEGLIRVAILPKQTHTNKPAIDHQLRVDMDQKVKELAGGLQNYQIRADTVETGGFGEARYLSWIADFVQFDRKMAQYMIWLRSENSVVEISMIALPADLPKSRAAFNQILQTVKLK